ncbi:MAG: tRNA (adenosine(37)-N6)-dimethylallyltransferase MiaA [Clostridiales bacterium]|nr:tRNA (adenosine(37)-N6)-dimethylallyltransferase MiaA [Clostridiales bacterium]
MKKKRVIGIVGPTASGKTALSLPVAKALGAEIVCMDSMQIYRGMDIGTAKPTPAERALVPHHMLDLLSPDQEYSVSQYAADARRAIEKIHTPLLVGGTGLYLQALSLPMDFGAVGGDDKIREKYHALADAEGSRAVHDRLRAVDPVSAEKLHPNDLRRVIRAIEVYELTGTPLSARKMPGPEDAPYDFLLYAVDLPRDTLYARVDRRVDEMMAAGLVDEVRALLENGLSPDAQSMHGLGYKELIPVALAGAPLADAVSLIKLRTRHFAKRQLTWFKRDGRIRWLPWQPGTPAEPLIAKIIEEATEE